MVLYRERCVCFICVIFIRRRNKSCVIINIHWSYEHINIETEQRRRKVCQFRVWLHSFAVLFRSVLGRTRERTRHTMLPSTRASPSSPAYLSGVIYRNGTASHSFATSNRWQIHPVNVLCVWQTTEALRLIAQH